MSPFVSRVGCATALALIMSMPVHAQNQTTQNASDEDTIVLDVLVVKAAAEQLKQALGHSNITAEDIAVRAPANDLSEVIRRMPGVNLTGNNSTGVRGNNRQIDIRGMGPENTLILIDGKPVLSRNSVRYGRNGERDTRGDSNWVPAEAVERIEVIRGPAAARYGSGAAGGVINIITKHPTEATYTFSSFANIPEHADEGGSRRANLVIGGPLSDVFSYRIFAGISQTDGDSQDVNDEAAGTTVSPAGREGVINRDIRGMLSYQIDADNRLELEASYSRQGNIFAGDSQYSNADALINSLVGQETNTMTRTTLAATHTGTYDFGDSLTYVQWERTLNRRLTEGLAGGPEGRINSTTFGEISLDNLSAKSEFNIPLAFIWDQTATIGVEYRGEFMHDPVSIAQGGIVGVDLDRTASDASLRDPNISTHLLGVYLEDNIAVTDQLIVTPGIRADYHSEFGINLSPSLNASYDLTDEITIKAGIARAFKAPNLYQLNPNYVYYTRGNGCPPGFPASGGVGCYVVGNPELDPEVSLNKEIGISYANVDGWSASATYYHNDYENRIAAKNTPIRVANPTTGAGYLFEWGNSGPAVISGIEGSFEVPVLDTLTWTTNVTKIIESVEKETGQPLSLIPEYTINTALRWEAMENLGLTLSATHYGKISPRTAGITGAPITDAASLEARDAYTIVNFGLDYEVSENFNVTAGVNNLFDERLFRTGNGANTFNEPGRSYYVSLTGNF